MNTAVPVVVVGASAGGVTALSALCAGLPAHFPAAVLVVLHIAADAPSLLPNILGRAGPLPAHHPVSGEPLRPGHIYVAPPDYHLLVEPGGVTLTRGPKENRSRPSVDALFRSAAYTYGPRVIGVILSGMLDDGVSGLYTIKRRGGQAVVQRPEEAEYDSMPATALREVEVDHVVSAHEMGALLTRLVTQNFFPPEDNTMTHDEERRLDVEVAINREDSAFREGVTALGRPSLLTCPECQGALVQIDEGPLLRFRCHTGHGYTASTLLSEVSKSVEEKAYQVLRTMEEEVMLLQRLGQQHEKAGRPDEAQGFYTKAREVMASTDGIRALAMSNQRLSTESILMQRSED
ncbi:chemotaxis protein CheB [Deinococcus navajonensis]|uniref:protein-glutamate methylesterase n=1 Tax=Deinococcus navajonensis TaxID=309884 RepID=A0ABV8XPW8_9DEIO